jgi:DNA-binding response OmpR family regulator
VTERLQGRVLIVDAAYNTLGTLSRAMRARGHHVTLCADGRAGLQRAVESAPDVVVVDRDVPVVDVKTFLEVLRDNPRTSTAHAFVLTAPDPGYLSALDPRVEALVKPFHVAEVVARLEAVLRARSAPRREPELRGDLAQVALFDLLQVFAANRRTGTLRVEASGASGEISVRDGRVVDCAFRGARGEKALYRLLSATEGQFLFMPDVTSVAETIHASTDMLMMEAVRQADELKEVQNTMPSTAAQVALARRPQDMTSMAERILTALGEDTRGIDELLDVFPDSDLDVMRGIKTLIDSNALVVLDAGTQRTHLCDEDEAVVLRAAALKLRPMGSEGAARLAILTTNHVVMARFARALSGVEGFVSEASVPEPAGEGSLGTIGSLRVGGVEVELFAVPIDRELRPLWGALLSHVRVAIWLGDALPDDHAREQLKHLRIDVVPVSSGWDHPQGAAETLRAALTSSTRPSAVSSSY